MECKGCEKGVAMCYNRPCMGSPEEFEAIIDAGFASKLRIDHWNGHHGNDITDLESMDVGDDPHLKILKEMAIMMNGKKKEPNPHKENVEFLAGGTPTDVNYHAPFWPSGRCNLLSEDNLCTLHDLGLKPTQGKESCCKSDDKRNDNIDFVNMWATPKGTEVIEKFKKAVGI